MRAMASKPAEFSIVTDDDGGRLLVSVRGELDLATAPQLEAVLFPALERGGRVLVDLRELAFMDSSGVRAIVAAHMRANGDGARFAVVRPEGGTEVWRIIEVSGLDAELRLLDDPESF
jgi:anti-anti-sigma factor